jgi:methyltransferase
MMKTLLIWPNNPNTVLSNDLSCCEPLSLEYIAGALSPFHEVEIWDMRLDPGLKTLAENYKPDVVGLAIPFTTSLPYALQLAKEVRQLWPDASLVLGGHHATVSDIWIDLFEADYLISGEGGNVFLNLLNDIERGKQKLKNAKMIVLEEENITTFDTIAKPDRSILSRHHDKYFHSIYNPVALIRFSAGCPYNCSFCILWKLTDRRYIVKNNERILEEMTEIKSKNLYVVDDEAFIKPERMEMLANAISGAGIRKKYHMYLRADTAVRHQKIIEKWAEIGLDSVLVGAESFSDKDLIDYSKKAMVQDTVNAIKIFHDYNIKVRANFIVKPDFTEADFKRLEESVIRLKIDLPSFAVLTPLPGTELYLKNKDKMISSDPELFDCYHTLLPTRLPIEEFYHHFAQLMINTSSGNKLNLAANDAPMFYFSNDNSFGKMINKIKNGHLQYSL